MPAIETKSLTKYYKNKPAVDCLNLTVETGEIFALLGVNGAGKTTTVKMLSCLLKPDSGEAWINGYSICKNPDKVKEISNVSPQETALAPNLTVSENLTFLCSLYGHDRKKVQQKKAAVLKQFGLEPVAEQKAKTLSGGWQRRLSIAMALITEPKILYLDEPTLGLDVLARRELWEMIRSLKGKVTVILTTHYLEEAEQLCDRVGIMANGRLLCTDTPKGLIQTANVSTFEDAFIKLAQEG